MNSLEVERLDDTLLVVLSDNGASQEGGPTGVFDEMRWFNGMREDVDAAVKRLDDIGGPESHSNIPWGWAQAGNAPLKWYKQNTHGGGVRDPLVPLPHSINLAAASMHHGTEVWRVEAPRDHAGAYRSAPSNYMRRCVAHIDAAVPSTIAAQTAG